MKAKQPNLQLSGRTGSIVIQKQCLCLALHVVYLMLSVLVSWNIKRLSGQFVGEVLFSSWLQRSRNLCLYLLVDIWSYFVSLAAQHARMMRSLLCVSVRYRSVFSTGCMRRSCCSVMTRRQKTCCSCCARPLRSRRETWWRPCCQVRQVTSLLGGKHPLYSC